ncbi:MAG: hypothetical protein RLZ98_974 [Pseudomonadota bacterium]|jgi:chromosomal replication initiator protein
MVDTIENSNGLNDGSGTKVKALLRARLGEDIYSSWFKSLELEQFDGETVRASVPVKFLRNWIQSHYADALLECCKSEFKEVQQVEVVLRQPVAAGRSAVERNLSRDEQEPSLANSEVQIRQASQSANGIQAQQCRTFAGGFEGSPLDSRYTFESFVVGSANRMAHSGALQVAETVLGGGCGFNPLFLHSSVGLGKTHLLHAIAWEVQRRAPRAQLLYLTAEHFRYRFVDALRSQDAMAFKGTFQSIDVLLIDDLEFLRGQQTEQEFDHIINRLLDSGRQVVVASSRAPNQISKLPERMRDRLQRGLVTEIGALDREMRLKVLEKRVQERRLADPSFEMSPEVLGFLAEKLTESGRELEGAVTRLHATWQYMRTPITVEVAQTMIRDLVNSVDARRLKIEDILKAVTRHFGISRGDILSQRRHRSVVRPRQIGMYLAKQLTERSLPEIGRRFGGRDHTTVLHAIRKIEGEIQANNALRDEIDDLKRLLGS